jgi:hypothetical protein
MKTRNNNWGKDGQEQTEMWGTVEKMAVSQYILNLDSIKICEFYKRYLFTYCPI